MFKIYVTFNINLIWMFSDQRKYATAHSHTKINVYRRCSAKQPSKSDNDQWPELQIHSLAVSRAINLENSGGCRSHKVPAGGNLALKTPELCHLIW